MAVKIDDLLRIACGHTASDLHLKVGAFPVMRIGGELHPVENAPRLKPEDTLDMAFSMMSNRQKQRFKEVSEVDIGYGVSGLGRFRANIFQQRGTVSIVLRVIPDHTKSTAQLGLPPVIDRIAEERRGLILVTGATGSGKSTTLAAMIDKINVDDHGHIVTLEDPVEFLHEHKNCIVNQREIGADTQSFKKALKSILRQDPDSVLIGELRDLETIEAALTIAETGHLVFGTLHTNGCVSTINRIIDAFPAYQQPQIRAQLSLVLEGVLSQSLVPKAGGGRAMCLEVMVPTPAIRNLVREDKIHQIYSQMQLGQAKFGMQTANQALYALVSKKQVSMELALEYSSDPEELRNMIMAGGPAQPPAQRAPGGAR